MKKFYCYGVLLFTIASLLLYTTSTAQIKVGAVGGLAISKFTSLKHYHSDFVTSFSTSPYLSYYTGVYAKFPIQKKIQLQSCFVVTRKGSETKSEVFSGFASFDYRKIRLTYIQVPLNIMYSFYKEKNTNAFFGCGLYAGRSVYGFETGRGIGYNDLESYEIIDRINFTAHNPGQLLPTNIHRYDVGYNLLAGVTIHHVEISGAFSRGFTNALSNADLYGGNYKNTTLNILFGYYITLNGRKS